MNLYGMFLVLLVVVTTVGAQGVPGDTEAREPRSQDAAPKDKKGDEPIVPGLMVTFELAATQPSTSQPAATQPVLNGRQDLVPVSDIGVVENHLIELGRIRMEAAFLLQAYEKGGDEPQSVLVGQLDALVQKCQALQSKFVHLTERIGCASLSLQIRYCLAQGHDDPQVTQERINQLNAMARSVAQLGGVEAQGLARFWLLQIDLLGMRGQDTPLDSYQHSVIARLEQFLEQPQLTASDVVVDHSLQEIAAASPALSSMLEAVKLALLQLYDQCGVSSQACELAEQLKVYQHRYDMDGRAYLDRSFGYCTLLGHRFDAKIRTDDGDIWSSEDHRRGPVLLHFWANWARPSVEVIDSLRQQYVQLHDRGLNILSIHLASEPDLDSQRLSVDWPTCSQAKVETNLAQLFQVTSLPRFVLIDSDGRIVAMGPTLGVLGAVEGLAEADTRSDFTGPGHTAEVGSDHSATFEDVAVGQDGSLVHTAEMAESAGVKSDPTKE